MKFLKIERYF